MRRQREQNDQLQEDAKRILADVEAAPVLEADAEEYVKQLEATRKAASEGAVKEARRLHAETEKRRREFLLARKEGRPLPPVTSVPITLAEDPTIPVDNEGKPLDPSFVYKWARTVDATEQVNHARVRDLTNKGFEVVKGSDGAPITQFRHILMRAKPEHDQARRAALMKDLVTQDRRKQQYHDAIDSINRSAGQEVVRPYVPEGGNTHSRTLEPMTDTEMAGFAERG
jgi:hypothetical protein